MIVRAWLTKLQLPCVFHLLRHLYLRTQCIPHGFWHANTLLMGHTAIFGLVR